MNLKLYKKEENTENKSNKMVTEELEIKEEPLDENENIQEMFNNQSEIANLLKPQQLQMELIKGMSDQNYFRLCGNMKLHKLPEIYAIK